MFCCRISPISFLQCESLRSNAACPASTRCRCNGGGQAHIHGKKNQTAWMHGSASSYCKPQREHMRSVLAWFGQSCWFLHVPIVFQEGTTVLGLATSHQDSVAESFLNIGDAIVRRQYTHRTRVQMIKPLMGRRACGTNLQSS